MMNPNGRLFFERWGGVAFAFTLVAFMPNLNASVIYNNFGSLYADDCCNAQGIFGAGTLLGFREVATTFTAAPEDTLLSEIDLALSWSAGTNVVDVSLESDNGGEPGNTLQTWVLNSLPTLGACCDSETLKPPSPLVLTSGTQYWIVAEPGASDFVGGWNLNTSGYANIFGYDAGIGYAEISGEPTPAFAVQTSPIPEPATWSFCAAALAVFGLRRRKR